MSRMARCSWRPVWACEPGPSRFGAKCHGGVPRSAAFCRSCTFARRSAHVTPLRMPNADSRVFLPPAPSPHALARGQRLPFGRGYMRYFLVERQPTALFVHDIQQSIAASLEPNRGTKSAAKILLDIEAP